MRVLIVSIALFIGSCTTGVELRPVRYAALFNDYNSKVWIVDKVKVDNAVISPSKDYDKHVMVFHYNRTIDYIPMKDIARKPPKKGAYFVDSDKLKMTIEFDDETWNFDLIYLTEDSVLMEPAKKTDFDASIKLKPFPEL